MLTLGTLERDQPLSLLLELVFPPRAPGTYRAAKLQIRTGRNDERDNEQDEAAADVVLTVVPPGAPLPPPDPRIMNLVETVGSFRLQTRALQELAAGDVGNATRKLEALETRFLQQGEAGMAAAVREELDNLAQQGQMSAAGTKKLTYETRRLTQKLG
jgi:Ca-activated chloride channel family protein